MTEEQLVRQAQKGDDSAFFALIHNHKEQLYRMAISFLKSEEAALEAIQEVTYRAYRKLAQLRQPAYFKTWLIRIMINYCINEQNRLRRFLPQKAEAEEVVTTDLDTRINIEQAVEQLAPRFRQVIILKYFEDLTITEIAQVMESPAGTIKTWLHKALHSLRKELGKGGEENV